MLYLPINKINLRIAARTEEIISSDLLDISQQGIALFFMRHPDMIVRRLFSSVVL